MIEISTGLRTARTNASLDYLDDGSNAAYVEVFDNTRPAFGEAAGVAPMVTLELNKPCGTVSSGVLTLNTTGVEGLIMRSGIAVWGRVYNGDGEIAFDCDVGGNVGLGEIVLSSTTLLAGGYVRLISGVIG